MDQLMNVVVADVDMLDLSMILGILCQQDGAMAVPFYDSRDSVLNCNLIQPTLHPIHLLSTS
jgi:hypothetical protein